MEERNLPLVSIPFIEKAYNKIVIPFLGKIDDGSVFKTFFYVLLYLIALALLIRGIVLAIARLFGESGFIRNYIANFGSVIGLIIGFVITIVTAWALYSVLKKRNEELKNTEYDGFLSYIFIKFIPKIIIIVGELIFVYLLSLGILQIIAALISSYVYAPLAEYTPAIYSFSVNFIPGADFLFNFIPGADFLSEMYEELSPIALSGDYKHFEESILMGIYLSVMSFIVLLLYYIIKEIYNYAMKLLVTFIEFLPNFSLPIYLKRKNLN